MPASGATSLGTRGGFLMCAANSGAIMPLNGGSPIEQLERDAADRVDIAARIRWPALTLLRRHVLRRSEHRAGRGQHEALFEIAEQDLREPEVEHLDDLAVRMIREHQVVRLEIAMDDAREVRVVQRICDLREDAERHRDRQRAARLEQRTQRRALDVLHRQVQPPVGQHAGVVGRHDALVRRADGRHGPRAGTAPGRRDDGRRRRSSS